VKRLGRWTRTVILIPLCWASISVSQQIPFPDLRVVKKPGAQTGSALVTIKSKNKILAHRAVQAWEIMDNENALVLVASRNQKKEEEYHLQLL
jgi:hypothetical protein